MPALTAAELSIMRDHAEEMLTDACTIEYDAGTYVKGKVAPNWTSRATSVPCRFAVVTVRDTAVIQAAQPQEGRVWMVSLPYDQAIEVGDRIGYGGNVYHPLWVNDDETERTLKRVACQRTN